MRRKELDALKSTVRKRKAKARDLDVIVEALVDLPPGQRKKVLTPEVLAVLEKYGHGV